jgi:hypothetical protein
VNALVLVHAGRRARTKFLLGDGYWRIDPVLNVPVKLDDAKHFQELRNKADIDEGSEKFLKRFLVDR